jgi:hypothetical protein
MIRTIAVTAAALFVASAHASVLSYTMTASGVAGSIDGTAFADATVTITTTRNTATSNLINQSNASISTSAFVTSPTITITTASNSWSGLMTFGLGVQQWQLTTLVIPSMPASQLMFRGVNASGPAVSIGLGALSTALFVDLNAPGTSSSDFGSDGNPFVTAFGTVIIDADQSTFGSMVITEVPAPGAIALLGLAGLAKRRRR